MNVALFIIKFAAGFVGHSAAMIADAGHTLSDLVSDAGKNLLQMRSCATLICAHLWLNVCLEKHLLMVSDTLSVSVPTVTLWAVRMSSLPPDAE